MSKTVFVRMVSPATTSVYGTLPTGRVLEVPAEEGEAMRKIGTAEIVSVGDDGTVRKVLHEAERAVVADTTEDANARARDAARAAEARGTVANVAPDATYGNAADADAAAAETDARRTRARRTDK